MCAKQKPKATLSAVREAQDKNHLAILDDKVLASLFKKMINTQIPRVLI